jgi:hypothetical protein
MRKWYPSSFILKTSSDFGVKGKLHHVGCRNYRNLKIVRARLKHYFKNGYYSRF